MNPTRQPIDQLSIVTGNATEAEDRQRRTVVVGKVNLVFTVLGLCPSPVPTG